MCFKRHLASPRFQVSILLLDWRYANLLLSVVNNLSYLMMSSFLLLQAVEALDTKYPRTQPPNQSQSRFGGATKLSCGAHRDCVQVMNQDPRSSSTTSTDPSTISSPEQENGVRRSRMQDNDNADSACATTGSISLLNSLITLDSSSGCGTEVAFAYSACFMKQTVILPA